MFKSKPRLLAFTAALGFIPFAAIADPAEFNGDWVNVDTDTRGITHFMITPTGTSEAPKIQVFGKCHPTDCDWDTEKLKLFSAGLSDPDDQFGVARYENKVGVTTLTMELRDDGRIFLDWFTDYHDNRHNTHRYDIFQKDARTGKQCPDLVVEQIFDPEWDGDDRQSVIRAKITNIGNDTAGTSYARLMDERLQPSGAPYNDVVEVDSLDPGDSETVTFTLPYWVFDPDANFTVTADYKGMVSECNEDNNIRAYNALG